MLAIHHRFYEWPAPAKVLKATNKDKTDMALKFSRHQQYMCFFIHYYF